MDFLRVLVDTGRMLLYIIFNVYKLTLLCMCLAVMIAVSKMRQFPVKFYIRILDTAVGRSGNVETLFLH